MLHDRASRRHFLAWAGTTSAGVAAGSWAALPLAGAAPTDSHSATPRLLLTAAGLTQLKSRIASVAAVKKQWEQLLSGLKSALKSKIELPPRGSNWHHWYVCPQHGNRLRTGKSLGTYEWEHICPVGNHVVASDPSKPQTDFDGCALASVHSGWAARVRDAGLAFQVTGEKNYRDFARDVLLAYAEKYSQYPLHTIRAEAKIGGGRIGPQTLDESMWFLPACQGADLIWASVTDAERATIADKLVRPLARDVILPHRMGVHNIQCWKNSAVGLAGFLLNDQKLIDAALDDPESGCRKQLEKGIQKDGMWWEGAWGYHFFTLSALWPLMEAARNCGIDMYSPAHKRMFDAPLELAMPSLMLPDFNDSAAVNLANEAPLYELAFARYRDPRYVRLFKRDERPEDTKTRNNSLYLIFGVDELPSAAKTPAVSVNCPTSGYAILTKNRPDNGAEQATWFCLKYGPHGGGHGHPDKLHFVLYALGQPLFVDAGITSYGSILHTNWYRTTFGHNTLTVNESSQKPAEGQCLEFGKTTGSQALDFAMVNAGPIYDGVEYTRTALLVSADCLVLVDQVKAAKPQLLDLAFHLRGEWQNLPTGTAWEPPKKPGYQYLATATARDLTQGLTLSSQIRKDAAVTLTFAGPDGAQLITATGPGSSTQDRVPVALVRRAAATETALVTVISWRGQSVTTALLPVQNAAGKPVPISQAVAVDLKVGEQKFSLAINPSQQKLTIRRESKSWQVTERVAAI